MRRALATASVSVLVAACSSPAKPPPITNVGAPTGELEIAPDQAMGWLALAPSPQQVTAVNETDPGAGVPWWLPVSTAAAAMIPAPAQGLAGNARVEAMPADGGPSVALVSGDPTTIPYGCENGHLDVVPLTGGALAPGVDWILPAPRPDGWAPAAVAVTRTRTEVGRAGWTIGPITYDLVRDARDGTHAALAISVDGREVAQRAVEKAMMDGGDPGPMDLTADTPGVPRPIAAFAIGAAGPWLVILLHPGYEGVSLTGEIVGRAGVREAGLDTYLYFCAF